MQWEFSAEDVVKARADYRLEHFRRDLAEEVRLNLGTQDEARIAATADLVYDLCYAMATAADFEAFVATHAYDPPTSTFVRELRPQMDDNAAMLGAILQRMIMDGVEAGVPLERAVEDAAMRHAQVTSGR